MAMIENVFVNLGSCGSGEDANGLGSVSLSGVRNFLRHPWPQMDIGEVKFYNPRVATNEVARNRQLTRNQAHWLVGKITAYINTLDIPNEDQFDQNEEHGRLRLEEDPEFKGAGEEKLAEYLHRSAKIADQEGKAGWAAMMREFIEMLRALHSLEALLTKITLHDSELFMPADFQTLARARAFLNPGK